MRDQLVAMTVSVNYVDILPLVLETNYQFFKHWYVVTEKEDTKTQELCSKYANVEVLFFDFKTNITHCCFACKNLSIQKPKFNKGGALRMAQQIANENFPNEFKLIMDSDICLPPIFLDMLKKKNLQQEVLYGAPRWIYDNEDDFINKPLKRKLEDMWVKRGIAIGFFQLYKSNNLYQDSLSCEQTDIEFCEKFKKKDFINLIINHIGKTGQYWNGK